MWIVRAWRSEDVVLYGKVGPPLLCFSVFCTWIQANGQML